MFSYDLWETYVVKGRSDDYYLRIGRVATVAATVIAIGTALFARNYQNIMTYLQTLFGFFNAPLFATFILGMFWKRMTADGRLDGPGQRYGGRRAGRHPEQGRARAACRPARIDLKSQGAAFAAAGAAFVVDIVVSVVVTMVTQPKPESELRGLVWSMTPRSDFHDANEGDLAWWQQPEQAGGGRRRHGHRPQHHLLVGARHG